jgi:sterol desaturase/sphingolipid hydroxylase (fatty acid hydroxylase superfamily)
MGLLSIEQSKLAYRADFGLYATAVTALTAFVALAGPRGHGPALVGWAFAGLVSWSAIEYALHRFVLHGLQPFRGWHSEHHERPQALICAPTILSAALIGALVFLPVLLIGNLWHACALTLGVLVGYVAYAITHHATHHWRTEQEWLKRRKRLHAIHHHRPTACYGVTTVAWDHVFGTAQRERIDRI